MTLSTTKTASPRKRAIGLTILAASVVVVLTTPGSQINHAAVEKSLQRFNEYVATDSAKSGKEGHFTYGNIEIKGLFFTQYALVRDVALQIKKQSLLESVDWALTTPQMTVAPDSVIAHRLYYTFAEPITVKKNGEAVATITFPDPLKYGQMDIYHGKTTFLLQTFLLPPSITVTPIATPNVAAGPAVVITYDKNPTMHTSSATDHPERKAEYEFKNIAFTSGTEKPLTADSFHSTLKEKPNAQGVVEGQFTMDVKALKTDATEKACDIATDITYTGDQPLLKLAGFVSGSLETAVAIKNAGIDCADFKVTTTGTLARSPEDPLPSGNISIKLDQVNKLLESRLLTDQGKQLLAQLLVKVTGQTIESITNVDLPLKREKNGTFYIGDVTFEELAASMLTSMFNQAPAPRTPAMPQPEPTQDEALPDPQTQLLETTTDATPTLTKE